MAHATTTKWGWQFTAKRELGHVEDLIKIMPLAEAVQYSLKYFRQCKVEARVREIDLRQTVIIGGLGDGKASEEEFLELLKVIQLTGRLGIDELGLKPLFDRLQEIRIPLPCDPLSVPNHQAIRNLIEGVIWARTDMYVFAKSRVDEAVKDGLIREESKLQTLGKTLAFAVDAMCASHILQNTVFFMRKDELELVSELMLRRMEDVKRYRYLTNLLARNPSNAKRIAFLTEKFTLACPEAREMLKQQSEIKPKKLSKVGMAEEEAPPLPVLVPRKRTVKEDTEFMRRHCPALYKMAMLPTNEEREWKRAKKQLSRLMRDGVPAEFIRARMREGVMDANTIADEFTSKRELTMPDEEIKRISSIIQTFALQFGSESAAGNGPPQQNAAKPVQTQKPVFNSIDEVLAAVQLDDETVNFITGKGLVSDDVICAVVRGFDVLKNKPAIGGVHRRGAVIRNNLRRYCSAHPDELLRFLKSVDVLNDDFGSAASEKTKDDAMSINIHPSHPIGFKLISAITRATYLYNTQGNAAPDEE